jgi:hypothetical protein
MQSNPALPRAGFFVALTKPCLHAHIECHASLIFQEWIMAFDYNAPAEIFAGRSMRGPRPMRYQRFETGAEALRFAIEVLPRANLLGAILEANERRYWHAEIRKLYDSSNYPLPRKEPDPEPEAKVQQAPKIQPASKVQTAPKIQAAQKKSKKAKDKEHATVA